MTQEEALAIMNTGKSVLLTGAAGTGKTYTLNKYIRYIRGTGKSVAVTATTGLAATHLGGTTIHSWAGIGVHDELPNDHVLRMGQERKKIINKADLLIIDEISMLHDYRLDMIDEVCRKVREDESPFGGLQIVLCGDFYQLPPVTRSDSPKGSNFITNSEIWKESEFVVCYLDEQFRQKEDEAYTDILNGIRAGVLTKRQLHNLQSTQDKSVDSEVATTKLVTTNMDTDKINDRHLAELYTDEVEYEMVTTGSKKYKAQLLKSCLAPETLTLKIGAQVMCVKNSLEKRYVNGSLGVVESFDTSTSYPNVRLNTNKLVTIKPDKWELVDGDKIRATATQVPLRLAWAITVHKSQGMTLDAAQIDLSRAFVEGMGYVALSRVKNMDNLVLDGINGMALQVSTNAKNIDKDLRANSTKAVKSHAKDIKQWNKSAKDRAKIKVINKSKSKTGWSDKLAKMRQDYPNAYKPWKESEDRKLVQQFSDGKTIPQLSKIMGRHKGSVKARLEKHFGEDTFA